MRRKRTQLSGPMLISNVAIITTDSIYIISDSVAAIIIIVVPTAANESAILLFYLFTEINALVLRVYKIGFK